MDRNVRPSGLTALAIINFIFAGLIGFLVMFSLGLLACAGAFARTQSAEPLGTEAIGVSVAVSLGNIISMALLIVTAIGYLKCNPILGRLLGNIYALVEITKTTIYLIFYASVVQQLAIFTVIAYIWPLITILFLNIVFRDVWRKRSRLADVAAQAVSGEAAPPGIPEVPAGRNTPHIILVMKQSVRQTMRGVQGVMFILITLVVSFLSLQVIFFVVQVGKTVMESQGLREKSQVNTILKEGIRQVSYGFFVWLFDDQTPAAPNGNPEKTIAFNEHRDAWADYVTSEKPALLSFIFAIMMTLFPILSAVLSFNQISEDARRKGFRYLLLRTTRSSIYFGKFLATIAIIVPIIVLTVAAIALFVSLSYDLYPLGDVISYSLWGMVMLIMVSVPSIAFCLFISALINSGIGSLAAGALTLGFFPLIARLLKDSASFLAFFQYFLPQKVAYFLMNPQWWVVLLAAVGCVAYAAAYSAGGYFYFKRKSL
ncbi:MAG: ABC transporter permease subunit [Spirochaetales bacterium]|nr:ABC transporter permease subunit [Spirochaetales bacterium]